ncbi:MAG: TIR domain-containing protein [Anaerolineales bacterium]
MAFDDLTDEQREFIVKIVELLNTGDYEEEFNAAGAGTGWFVILSGKNGKTGIELDGFRKTTFLALDQEGYLTLEYLGSDGFLCSPKPKAYREYQTMTNPVNTTKNDIEITKNPKRVFVINGRNEGVRRAFFELLRSMKLEPIEWNEALALTKHPTPYIGDTIDKGFEEAQAFLVLLTPEDVVYLHNDYQKIDNPAYEKEETLQPRPNVIFEAGMAMGKNPMRTVLVQVGQIKPFSDIAGRHTLRWENKTEKRQELANRLSTAGCDVDILTSVDWHTAGDFSFDLPELVKPRNKAPKPDAEEKTLLELIASQEREKVYLEEIYKLSGMDKKSVDYYLGELVEKDLLHRGTALFSLNSNNTIPYSLTQPGRALLILK